MWSEIQKRYYSKLHFHKFLDDLSYNSIMKF